MRQTNMHAAFFSTVATSSMQQLTLAAPLHCNPSIRLTLTKKKKNLWFPKEVFSAGQRTSKADHTSLFPLPSSTAAPSRTQCPTCSILRLLQASCCRRLLQVVPAAAAAAAGSVGRGKAVAGAGDAYETRASSRCSRLLRPSSPWEALGASGEQLGTHVESRALQHHACTLSRTTTVWQRANRNAVGKN